MHVMIKTLFTSALLLLIAGCGTTQQSIVADYDSSLNYKYPNVSIYYDAPSKNSLLACKIFELKLKHNKCNLNSIDTKIYKNEFDKSSLFYNVFFANNNTEYAIAIATAGHVATNNSPHQELVQAEVSIYWQNFIIQKYHYELPYIYQKSAQTINHQADQEFAQSLVSHIIADIQKDNLFSTSFLTERLKTSDYENDLSVPTAIENFEYTGQFLYNNPLLGSVINYASPTFHSDKIDLYVYPIRHVDVKNTQALLTQESVNIQTEFTVAAKELDWTKLTFSTNKILDIKTDKQSILGVYFEGDYFEKFGEKNFTAIYLFKIKDKFVKFKTSFPASFITEHIKGVIDQIDVPDESIFMKKLRQESHEKMMAKNKENS